MCKDSNDAAIVRSTIDLARHLGKRTVAEGVEDQEVWDQLGKLGCEIAQGFWLGRPAPADDLTRVLLQREETGPGASRLSCTPRPEPAGRGGAEGHRAPVTIHPPCP